MPSYDPLLTGEPVIFSPFHCPVCFTDGTVCVCRRVYRRVHRVCHCVIGYHPRADLRPPSYSLHVFTPQLPKLPRAYRALPLVVLTWGILYVNTYIEYTMVHEKTGLSLPPAAWVFHSLFAAIWIAMIFLPEPGMSGKDKSN